MLATKFNKKNQERVKSVSFVSSVHIEEMLQNLHSKVAENCSLLAFEINCKW